MTTPNVPNRPGMLSVVGTLQNRTKRVPVGKVKIEKLKNEHTPK